MALKDIRPALRAFLLGDAGLSAAVGAGRIYPDELPQGVTGDSVVYSEISAIGDHHNEGPSGLAQPRYQFSCWSKTKDGAYALSLLLQGRLDGYRGVMGAGAAAVTVQGVFLDNSRTVRDDAAKLFGRQQDYFIFYEER
ncbi:tail completion protein gp17 [Pseudorhodoplanes sinuspersici]|uniref:Uncharacterized protein n=1 Tax=Pseudorhodoplanes sinuspersici TaxID=1235591 RepID=A0A1W6ZWW6_9HYPH|nr:DUF3168 domain-containing protein [Pseudorhodoplanes sinuspersici]ARQ01887.1 hypothetical protein CAK95_24405 [Pseudorhodoplanes sinuspersici]RKE73652.1 uncharacterized protein DUF3168 [Pseudorhodoplanes sinuspersici]